MPESAPAADWSWQDDPDVISWDWRQGPDLDELRDLLARHGLSVAEVDTGTDDVAIRIGSTPVEVMEGALCRHEPGQPAPSPAYPTDAEILAGMQRAAGEALERYLIGLGLDPTLIRPYAAGAAVLADVLPDHDARVRADERQRMEAAGWRPPIRHGDPHMLAAAYGYELGEQEELPDRGAGEEHD